MPLLQKNQKTNLDLVKNRFQRPTTLDREQLEYSAHTLFTYGTILFLAIGVGASVTYMTVQQLKK